MVPKGRHGWLQLTIFLKNLKGLLNILSKPRQTGRGILFHALIFGAGKLAFFVFAVNIG
jgi:hypothetical protein